jgi:hypothetical protein
MGILPPTAVSAAAALAWLLTGCLPAPSPLQRLRSEAEREQGQALVAPLEGGSRALLLVKCELVQVDLASRELKRQRVLAPDFYPLASCFDQCIEQRPGELRVMLLMRALGSGGGNQGGGTYRSRDGRHWERLGLRRTAVGWTEAWVPLP